MAILQLRSITCLQQAETFEDELYVTFNGTKTSLPNMTQGQTEPLRRSREVDHLCSAEVTRTRNGQGRLDQEREGGMYRLLTRS